MRIYTICVSGSARVVLSVDAQSAIPDELTTNPGLIQSRRTLQAELKAMPLDMRAIMDRREIDDAMEAWLGEDLQSNGLWSGDPAAIEIREANTGEAEQWHLSRRSAINQGELEPGDESWLIFVDDTIAGLRPSIR